MYKCDRLPCKEANISYIGHTTTTLKDRLKQHTSIKRHYREEHNINITGSQMINNTNTLIQLHNKQDLIIMEALLIKQHKPIINIQTEDFNRTLKIFK